MFSLGTNLILLVLVLAGTVAFVGDYIGRTIGRKRLRFLKLRPHHTAIFFTVLTGIMIALFTILTLLAVSQDVRTALFGLKELKAELKARSALLEKTKSELAAKIIEREKINQDLQASRIEVTGLQKTKQNLEEKIYASRQGKILFKVGETVLTSLIKAGPEVDKLEAGLRQILTAADNYVRSFGPGQQESLVDLSPEEFSAAIKLLKQRRGENIVSLIATRNCLFGEAVSVHLEIFENKLIYQKGQAIAEITTSPSLPLPQLEQEIKRLLASTHQSAKEAGVMPNPSGSVGSVPYAEIFSLAQKIKHYKKDVQLKTIAENDIYAIGPLSVDFKIY